MILFRVLIVDDEPSARLGLRDCFDWTRLECELAGEAEDGQKALLLLEGTPVDIVITDVKMPNMDGVSLSREIARRYPEMKVIIISGYGEVDYLKAALKVSAVDYILKPIQLKELEDAVRRAVEGIKEVRSQKNKLYQMDVKLLRSMPLLKEKFFMTLIRDDIQDNHALKEQMQYLNIRFPVSGKFCAVVVSLGKMEQSMAEREYQRLSFAILNICQELLEQHYAGYCFESERGEYVCLVSLGKKDESGLRRFSEEVRDSLCNYLELGVSLGIGLAVDDITKLKESYLSAVHALNQRLVVGNNRVFTMEKLDDTDGNGVRFDHALTQKLTESLRAGNYVETKQLTEAFFDALLENKSLSPNYVQSMCLFLLFIPERVIAEEMLETDAFSYDSQQQYQELCEMETIDEMKQYILQKYRELCDYINQNGGEGNAIRSVKKRIDEQYSKNLTIKELAAEVYLSPTYLSYLFKQKTGYTINDYITAVRMEKAKELLRDPKNTLYDIARAVGYHEPGYFTRIFKKYTGQIPSRYRESL